MNKLLKVAPFVLCLAAPAATTSYWEMSSYSDFLKGKLEGASLTRDGRLRIAPKAETLFTAEQPVIWSMARGPESSVYLATGHLGQLYRVHRSGRSELIWTAPEPEVFAIAVDAKGVLYAGTSPDGKIYRIEAGKATEYFAPGTRYIWSLAVAGDGALYAGTGDGGKIFRITAAGTGEVWYESGQSHITALALDAQGRLLAGTEPNGILYRVTAKDKAFVLYDANLPEIRAIVPTADGGMYVAALGGAFGSKPAGAAGAVTSLGSGAVVSTTPTTITVEAAQTQGGVEIKPTPQQPKSPTPQVSSNIVSTPVVDMTGVEKAALYRIQPDNMVETLWSSKEENIYDIAPSGQAVLFSTDGQGRVYRLEADRKATLLLETREGEATRLLPTPEGLLTATSHAGRLLRIGSQPGDAGTFESPVHDASSTARWGRIRFVSETPQGAKLALRTRSGNSAKPDQTWSDWSEPITASDSAIASPNARYIQWKAEFTGSGGRTPELDQVTIAYLPQNTAPVVKSVNVTSQATASASAKPASSAAPNSVYTVTVSDSGDGSSSAAGTPAQTVSRPSSGQLVITWQADDTDGDRLAYTIAFRGEEEREWKTLKTNWTELALTLDGDAFADGRYRFRVIASDAVANPAALAREGELVSAPVLIDNTPPRIQASVPRRNGAAVEVEVNVEDGASVVKRAEYSLDAGPFFPLAVEDGVADSLRERFRTTLSNVAPGEHLLVIRAYDSAGNSGVAKVVLK
ncbi:MAG: hypothetical protein JST93_29335 [Acidobacteria bacterium]|nr:hypothetical protein [Acidobacteriota bacterium]